jgi:hypothetical protein
VNNGFHHYDSLVYKLKDEIMTANDTSPSRSGSRIPRGSFLFDKLIPASLVFMALITLAFILFALAVLAGWINF